MNFARRTAQASSDLLLPQLTALMAYHRQACPAYARVLEATGHPRTRRYQQLAELPWLPVRLFKEHALVSTAADPVTTLTSSGTTGAGASRIALDREAAERQRHMLIATLVNLVGPQRLPLLIIDAPSAVRQQRATIRGATVLGVMNIGRDPVFALDEDLEVNAVAIDHFLQRHAGSDFLIFGFTFLVWSRFYSYVRSRAADLSHAVLLHTGGWKKLADQAVTAEVFRGGFREHTGLTRCHNFYGMVEQGGTIHVESASGDGLYCPDHADVIIRDPLTWQEAAIGTLGVIEVLSTTPRAHPGHILLTEDLGMLLGVDDGEWPGKRFAVAGRLPKAEPRGCSDTLAQGVVS